MREFRGCDAGWVVQTLEYDHLPSRFVFDFQRLFANGEIVGHPQVFYAFDEVRVRGVLVVNVVLAAHDDVSFGVRKYFEDRLVPQHVLGFFRRARPNEKTITSAKIEEKAVVVTFPKNLLDVESFNSVFFFENIRSHLTRAL